jgi:hypothetical protein
VNAEEREVDDAEKIDEAFGALIDACGDGLRPRRRSLGRLAIRIDVERNRDGSMKTKVVAFPLDLGAPGIRTTGVPPETIPDRAGEIACIDRVRRVRESSFLERLPPDGKYEDCVLFPGGALVRREAPFSSLPESLSLHRRRLILKNDERTPSFPKENDLPARLRNGEALVELALSMKDGASAVLFLSNAERLPFRGHEKLAVLSSAISGYEDLGRILSRSVMEVTEERNEAILVTLERGGAAAFLTLHAVRDRSSAFGNFQMTAAPNVAAPPTILSRRLGGRALILPPTA